MVSALDNTSKTKQHKAVALQQQQQQAAACTLMPISSWADYDEEDDDEFFAHVAPLPSPLPLKLETIQEEEEGEGEEGEVAETSPSFFSRLLPLKLGTIQEDDDEEEESPTLPLQQPSTTPPVKQVLTKEQRRHEIAEIDYLAELVLTCALTAKQWAKKEEEEEQHRRLISQGLSTWTSTKVMYKPPLAHKSDIQAPLGARNTCIRN